MLDRSLINRKLERVDNYLKQIHLKKDPGLDLFAKDTDQSLIPFNLIQAIQACIDIGAHIMSDSERETPGTLADIFHKTDFVYSSFEFLCRTVKLELFCLYQRHIGKR